MFPAEEHTDPEKAAISGVRREDKIEIFSAQPGRVIGILMTVLTVAAIIQRLRSRERK